MSKPKNDQDWLNCLSELGDYNHSVNELYQFYGSKISETMISNVTKAAECYCKLLQLINNGLQVQGSDKIKIQAQQFLELLESCIMANDNVDDKNKNNLGIFIVKFQNLLLEKLQLLLLYLNPKIINWVISNAKNLG